MPFKSLEHPATAKDKGPPECTHCCSSSVMNHSRTIHIYTPFPLAVANQNQSGSSTLNQTSNSLFLKKKTTIVHSTSNTSVTKFYPTVQISYTKTMPRWVYRPASKGPIKFQRLGILCKDPQNQNASECSKKSFLFRTTTPKRNMCNIGPWKVILRGKFPTIFFQGLS